MNFVALFAALALSALALGNPNQVRPGTVTVIAAGDIASCATDGDARTAALVEKIPGTVLVLGDAAYSSRGDPNPYENCYGPTWGKFKSRTRVVPGNHDYASFQVDRYFRYFGGDRDQPYFSFDLGSWHIVGLNTNIGYGPSSRQLRWLDADLAANQKKCTLAFMHHPRFSSGKHGNSRNISSIWKVLENHGADVVLAGHEHIYERFAPMTSDHRVDRNRGIRQFVVGTGGINHYRIQYPQRGSEVRDDKTYGVLKLDLGEGKYTWQFIPVAKRTFTDRGSDNCH